MATACAFMGGYNQLAVGSVAGEIKVGAPGRGGGGNGGDLRAQGGGGQGPKGGGLRAQGGGGVIKAQAGRGEQGQPGEVEECEMVEA
jgi:hypothetical protein